MQNLQGASLTICLLLIPNLNLIKYAGRRLKIKRVGNVIKVLVIRFGHKMPWLQCTCLYCHSLSSPHKYDTFIFTRADAKAEFNICFNDYTKLLLSIDKT